MLALWTLVPVKPSVSLLVAVLFLDLAVLAWQLTLIRTARRIAGTGFASFALAILAILTVALTLHTDANRMAMAYLRPLPVPAPPLALEIEQGTVYLSGEIGFDSYNAMAAALRKQVKLTHLELNSDGGRISAARGIARLVREAGLSTRVSGTCASACTIIFAAGKRRTLSDGARIGFHGYRLVSNVTTLDTDAEQERDKAEFIKQGMDPAFVNRALAIPHDDMWFPSRAELRAAGVLTE